MKEYIEWLENRIEICLEDKDLQREHWAFCQALAKMRDLQLLQPDVIKSVCKHEYITDADWKSLTCRLCNNRIEPTRTVL
jgi:hypothetical protein